MTTQQFEYLMAGLSRAGMALLLAVSPACEHDLGDDEGVASDDASSDGDGDGDDHSGEERVAFVTQVFAGEDQISYVVVSDTLDPGAPLTLDGATEIAGRAIGAGPGDGSIYVGSNTAPTITKYTVDDSGTLTEGVSISMVNQGVSGVGEYQSQLQVLSPTTAYYFDGATAQAVAWNPTDMTITGTIPFPAAVENEARLTFAPAPLRDGERLLMPLGWRSHDNLTIIRRAAMLVIDSATSTAALAEDERCGYVRDAAHGPDGMVYVATEAYGAAVHRIAPDNAPAPCLLRFDPTTNAFDPNFFVELSTLTDGALAGSMIVAPDGTALLRVLDESLVEITDETHPRMLASLPAWNWWKLELGDTPTAIVVDTMPPSSGSTLLLAARGRHFFPEFAADYGSTALRELTGTGDGQVTLTLPGLAFSLTGL